MTTPMVLSVFCVTKLQSYSRPFLLKMREIVEVFNQLNHGAQLVLGVDGGVDGRTLVDLSQEMNATVVSVRSMGYLESVHDQVLAVCRGRYVLRLDDDETCSDAMRAWVLTQKFLDADHWSFPRIHLWGNTGTAILTAHLFPDHQTRLSVREKAGGRTGVHAGSPHGLGMLAPVSILHHKFLVKTYEERAAIAARYDSYSPGYGTGNMLPFSLPEDAYKETKVITVTVGNGMVPWTPECVSEVQL